MSHATKPACLPESLIIAPRFCGPPGSGNGGYTSGRIAAHLDGLDGLDCFGGLDGFGGLGGPVQVTLRRPAPLATALTVERVGPGSVRVRHGATLVAEGTRGPDGPTLDLPGAVSIVSIADARAAGSRCRFLARPEEHPFPACFVCGPERAPGDGLRIFPGPLAGGPLWAAPWTPDSSVTDAGGRVRPEVVWAALDCPSGFAVAEAAGLAAGPAAGPAAGLAAGPAAGLARDTAILLGRMTASLAVLPVGGDECRVIAWPGRRDGRKFNAGSALLGPDGTVLAAARTVWLTVPRPVPALAAEALAAEGAS